MSEAATIDRHIVGEDGGHHDDAPVAHHFEDIGQQREAATLGMWLFLAQEVMFFGGLFGAYTVYRYKFPEAWLVGSNHLNLPIGFGNTLVLLCSSLTMATAAHYAVARNSKKLFNYLVYTTILGGIFLIVKVFEYRDKYLHGLIPGIEWHEHAGDPDGIQLFYIMYFLMSGMHALHMVIGIGILAFLLWMTKRGRFVRGDYMMVELFGYYWHFVDIVWVYLFPLLYLIDRSGTSHV